MRHSNADKSRACNGKRRHATHAAATRAAFITSSNAGDLGLVVYSCSHCGGYHSGHPRKSEQRRLRYKRLLDLIDKANGR